MIEIPRKLLRELRSVLAKAFGRRSKSQEGTELWFSAGPEGLTLRAATAEVAIAYHLTESCAPQQFHIPVAVLDECAGRSQDVRCRPP